MMDFQPASLFHALQNFPQGRPGDTQLPAQDPLRWQVPIHRVDAGTNELNKLPFRLIGGILGIEFGHGPSHMSGLTRLL
jgi:hypothetical protein